MDKDKLQPKIIWFSIFMVPFILMFVLHSNSFAATDSPSQTPNMMLFYVLAAGGLLLGLTLPRFISPMLKANTNAPTQPYLTVMIIRMAFFEMIALAGFIPANLGHNVTLYYPFFVTALAAMLYFFPTDIRMQEDAS
ncbi:MAG: hypothetical protein KDK51_01775 [Deltaproteobacteria bacterium]|nr:hypothetical protein [Deltaproteobacteria bacterium]